MQSNVLPLIQSAELAREPRPADGPAMMLSRADLAHELRVSPRTIDRLQSGGKLPAPHRFLRSPRWPRETILRWLSLGCPNRREFERLTVATVTKK